MEAKIDAKRLALDEGVVEEESELFFSGGKDDWQKFWDTTLAIDQKEREPAWQEAILLLMRWTKDDLAFLMVLEQVLREIFVAKGMRYLLPNQKVWQVC